MFEWQNTAKNGFIVRVNGETRYRVTDLGYAFELQNTPGTELRNLWK